MKVSYTASFVGLTSVIKRSVPASIKRRIRGTPSASERPWSGVGALRRRGYLSQEEYVGHQRSKLHKMSDSVKRTDQLLESVLRTRLGGLDVRGRTVLCLAARLGGEVRAFRDAGAFAIGIDLEPGVDNPWVLTGNFHALEFPDESVDIVYTNSMDHAFDLGDVSSEVARVLKIGGVLVLELTLGTDEGGDFGSWEATSWRRVDDVVSVFAEAGFLDEYRRDFDEPWRGVQVRMRRHVSDDDFAS